jgi:hypothetical protein
MSLTALPVHVALVDETGKIDRAYLQATAGALNEQIARDFGPVWHVRASVGAYDVAPAGTWAVLIRDQLDEPGALGYHADELGQPVSYVMWTQDWSATVSHEVLEMLADPWGNRLHGGRLPAGMEMHFRELGLKTEHSHVSYLLEVADPPEARSYPIGDILVSDFILPHWYSVAAAAPYSFVGTCTRPREVASGGYVSFHVHGDWWQVTNFGGRLRLAHLGRFDRSSWSSLREFTDHAARMRQWG